MYSGNVGAGLLGEAPYCTGAYSVGGAFKVAPDFSTLTIWPDDDPGNPVVYTSPPGYATSTIKEFAAAQGSTGRAVARADWISDGRKFYYGGSGRLSANEFAKKQGPQGCNVYTTSPDYLNIPQGVAEAPEPTTTTAPTAPPSWTGPQDATVHVDGAGIPEHVTIYGADGWQYKLASASNPTDAMELATTAPQGTHLTITAMWDAAAGLAAVTDWYVTSLGPGQKKYGVDTTTGEVVPPGPGIPSTDYPGGQPAAAPAADAGGPSAAPAIGAPLSRGETFALFGLLLAIVGFSRRR